MKIPLEKIIIGERQRIDLGDPLNDLASMGDPEIGQINPITVEALGDGTFKLLAGRRRLEYARRSNWPAIEAVDRKNLSELQRQKIELLEDIERKDRTWQESCLAFHKLYHLQKIENPDWNIRVMAKFTGMSKSPLGYCIQIGQLLRAEPRDAELWQSDNFTGAIRLLVERNTKEAQDEMDRRRLINAQAVVPATTSEYDDESPAPSPAPEQDTTAGEAPVLMRIFGQNLDFASAKPDLHFLIETAMTVLVMPEKDNGRYLENVAKALRPGGFAVHWGFSLLDRNFHDLHEMPWLLRWNQVIIPDIHAWPFVPNYIEGAVYYKDPTIGHYPNPSTATVSAIPDDLAAVVSFCVNALAPPETAVLCPNNAPVVEVAMTGHIPIWFEPDKARFDEKVAALKAYYEENIPNVKCLLLNIDATGDNTFQPI